MSYIDIQKMLVRVHRVVLVPEGCNWRRMHAHPDGTRRVCKWHYRESYKALFDLLHEIGHLETMTKSMGRTISEIKATEWAVDRLRSLGITVKRRYVHDYKKYITMTHDRAKRRGLKAKISSTLILREEK